MVGKVAGHYAKPYMSSNVVANASIIGMIGGIASEASGGDFYEGAMAAAFVYLFNDMGMRESFAMLWEKITDGTIAEDAKSAVLKGGEGAVKAWNKSPWYAKAPLVHAGGIVGVGAYSGGVLATGVVLTHPIETTRFVRGLTSGNPSITTATSVEETTGFAIRNIIDMVFK